MSPFLLLFVHQYTLTQASFPTSLPAPLFSSFLLTCSVRVIIRTSRMMTGEMSSTTQSSAMPITTWLFDAFISETSVLSITCLVKDGVDN